MRNENESRSDRRAVLLLLKQNKVLGGKIRINAPLPPITHKCIYRTLHNKISNINKIQAGKELIITPTSCTKKEKRKTK